MSSEKQRHYSSLVFPGKCRIARDAREGYNGRNPARIATMFKKNLLLTIVLAPEHQYIFWTQQGNKYIEGIECDILPRTAFP
jgi:hypothetical protein